MTHSESASAPIARAVLLAAPPHGGDALLWSLVAGKPLLAWPLTALRATPEIGPVALVVPHARLDEAARLIATEGLADTHALVLPPDAPLVAALDLAGVEITADRGRARHVSPLQPSGEGQAPARMSQLIVLHDASYPLVTPQQVRSIVAASVESGVVVSAEPVKETIKRVAEGRVVETLPRDELRLLVPPLAIRADVLAALLATGQPTLARTMDYVAAALAGGIAVKTVPLAGPSLTITAPEDVTVAEALLRASGD